MSKRLYVGNLPFSATDADLQAIFADAGAVASAKVIMDRDSGRSKGFGFVEMDTPEAAVKAIEMFNGGEYEGRQIRVSEAQPQGDRPRGGPGGGGGFGGGGGRGGPRGDRGGPRGFSGGGRGRD
jgi:cold-inducible RNA-binding protein